MPMEQHVCYQCLLPDNSGLVRLQALEALAKKRRLLWLIYDQHVRPESELLKRKLGWSRLIPLPKIGTEPR